MYKMYMSPHLRMVKTPVGCYQRRILTLIVKVHAHSARHNEPYIYAYFEKIVNIA